jgi:hypothetical protein
LPRAGEDKNCGRVHFVSVPSDEYRLQIFPTRCSGTNDATEVKPVQKKPAPPPEEILRDGMDNDGDGRVRPSSRCSTMGYIEPVLLYSTNKLIG